jgi:hypothetical protein
MSRQVLYSKLVFVDSHDGVRGAKSLKPSFHVPTNAFSCGQGESMRMVLKSFTMPKAFYNINQTNNTFFYRKTDTLEDIEIVLQVGDYTATELASEIQARVRANSELGGTSFTCVYSAKTRKFIYTIPSTYASGHFVCYFDKSVGRSADNQAHYSDAYEVLGGTPSTNINNPVNLFTAKHTAGGGSTIMTSKYPIRLSTIENIYLRCSAQGDAYCTTTYEPFKTGNKLDSTDIWACIPNVENANGNIVLVDNSEDFQIHIKQGQISDLKFSLSDGKGRELPLVSDTQAQDGNINFNLCFKFEIMSEPHEAQIVREGVWQYRHPPEMTK